MLLNPYRFGGSGPAPSVEDYPKLTDYASGSFNTSNNSHAIPLGTYSAGDLVFIFFASRSDNTSSPTLPAGWTGVLSYANTTPTPDGRRGYMCKVMTGSEGSSVTLTLPDSRAITYNRLCFKAGSYDSDLGYLFQFAANGASGTSADPADTRWTMYFKAMTVIRNLALFGLGNVNAYPFPSGEQSVASGTGVAATSAKSYVNVGQDQGEPAQPYNWAAWGMDSSSAFHEIGVMLRGSRPLGHIDPRYLTGFAFTAASSSVAIGATSNLKVGDMLILVSQARSGFVSSATISGGFTSVYTSGLLQVMYRIVTADDIGPNLTVTYNTADLHAFQILRVRAGTFEAGAVPQMISTATATSNTPTIGAITADTSYIGKRNLRLLFEGQIATSGTPPTLSSATPTIGPFAMGGSVANSASCGIGYSYFDGNTVPAASGVLTASATWTTFNIILKGLPIP